MLESQKLRCSVIPPFPLQVLGLGLLKWKKDQAIHLFQGALQPVLILLIIEAWKAMWLASNVLGPMQQIDFLRVLEMPVSCWAYDCTKTLCEGWIHKVLQVYSWTRIPAVMDAARYEMWLGSNQLEAYGAIVLAKICALKVVPVADLIILAVSQTRLNSWMAWMGYSI